MELQEAIRKRHSVRIFSTKPVGEAVIQELIQLANLAPSAGNLKAREFICTYQTAAIKELSQAANQPFFSQAPCVIVACVDHEKIEPYRYRGETLFCIQDSAAAIEHILLLAVEAGLAACWVGAFDETKVAKIMRLPPKLRPVALIPIGYERK